VPWVDDPDDGDRHDVEHRTDDRQHR
jgi:hypothetical protein